MGTTVSARVAARYRQPMDRVARALGLALIFAGLVGCGGGGQSMVQVVSATLTKTDAAKTARLRLTIAVASQKIVADGVFDQGR
jgi:hypothetical protein